MENKVKKEGKYELFVTTKDHRILFLDDDEWFAVIEGQLGEILIKSNSDHQRKRTIMQGKYLLVDFNEDPEFKDIPHLFLEKTNKYEEWVLPNGLPINKGEKVKIINTKHKVDSKKIYERIKGKSTDKKENDLETKSKSELLTIAKDKNLKGRSKMSKEELIEELSR